jgi:hypothetical protein
MDEQLKKIRKCCQANHYSPTGKYDPRKHTHARDATKFGRVDQATGYKFKEDKSTTKAVLKNMRALGVIE